MIRYASVFALVLFTSFHAFAQAPAMPSADGMKAAAASTATQAKTATAAEGAKANATAGAATTQAKGAANTGSAGAQAAAGDAAKAGNSAKAKGAKLLDLNSASVDELKAVPALAPVADKIIAARPFANKSQLVSKKLLDKATYAQVKDLVVAHKTK